MGILKNRMMSKAYAHNAWRRSTDTGRNLTDFANTGRARRAHDEREDEFVAAELVAAVVPTANNDALLDVIEENDCKLERADGLEKIERVDIKPKLHGLLEKCRAKRKNVPMSVVVAFTLTNAFLGGVNAHMSMLERAIFVNHG